jgi:hypothetical protein
MKEEKILKDVRKSDPYVDRRSGEDRRQVYDADYFQNGGLERRIGKKKWQRAKATLRKTEGLYKSKRMVKRLFE